ncbi:hypothetical protein N5I79_26075 [Klebsiella quasipneumoniae]|uniref:crAss001_48 related protein n=1 Tax=Klebsiella pneumoniae complex TaxID=3390273 RepID=UPI0009F04F31|nr:MULTISPECIES: hypothetical protein [Klebsiella]MBC5274325.1 hypothetical protein [Klebsiella pneumoniae]MCF0369884.1 hypothetical protein [Klebsiella pneumoniae]MCL3581255.1 hypothetical protein [Klebsiella pneumoniae]MCP5820069.1 hypothetical protein [Klebsiella pneumoniae]MCU8631696.1 hypothetical protein [Klebsiella pneumoniae]
MKELKPHQQRLIVEHDELKAKIEGLEKFIVESPIFGDLHDIEKKAMELQLKAMRPYLKALDIRIQMQGRKSERPAH